MTARLALWCLCIGVLPFASRASETVCLKNGFCLEAESHVTEKDRVVCHVDGGSVEFSNDLVASIQHTNDPAKQKSEVVPVLLPTPSEVVTRAALSQGLDAAFVRSVAKIESALQPAAISPKGALGLMQLMPATAADLGVDPAVSASNAEGGAKYLRSLLLKYRGDSVLALAAYNAGPAAVARFGGVPPYEETRQYIVKVLREYERQHKADSVIASAVTH